MLSQRANNQGGSAPRLSRKAGRCQANLSFPKSHPRGFAPEGESGQHHMRCLTLADNKVASAFAPPARQDGSAADKDSQRFDSECFWKLRSGLAQTVANHFPGRRTCATEQVPAQTRWRCASEFCPPASPKGIERKRACERSRPRLRPPRSPAGMAMLRQRRRSRRTAGPGARDRHRCQAKSRVEAWGLGGPQHPPRLSPFWPEAKHHSFGKRAPSVRRKSQCNGFAHGHGTLQKCAAELCGHGHL